MPGGVAGERPVKAVPYADGGKERIAYDSSEMFITPIASLSARLRRELSTQRQVPVVGFTRECRACWLNNLTDGLA
jgi:hypothetical protein